MCDVIAKPQMLEEHGEKLQYRHRVSLLKTLVEFKQESDIADS